MAFAGFIVNGNQKNLLPGDEVIDHIVQTDQLGIAGLGYFHSGVFVQFRQEVPRSVMLVPFQRVAWNTSPFVMRALPTTEPALLMPFATDCRREGRLPPWMRYSPASPPIRLAAHPGLP